MAEGKKPTRAGEDVRRAYEGDQRKPLRGYAVLLGTYLATVGGLAGTARALGRPLPDRVRLGDFALLSLATHKLSRLLTKDSVTSPLRAPFTRYRGRAGASEVNEEPRGGELRHRVGELLTCPFCTSMWVSTALTAGVVLAPRLTRLVCAGLGAVAVSDALQLAYDAGKKAVGATGDSGSDDE
ncbi:Protein of unknown function (DUF1360) [Streptoalloteichus tenebrarius]|uniref:DUF1360 domain-containing protein n=1 Tax=Streptoalloteichus tenebrarius (strain ATCC 17920 / DSM 40477 / JCM 4838 / CBS 697.72 / NBRC 16177 / NCIMB 11028 / NRRL B-12390 / A12253. 1 / ISP 5477) TaxID=1933 RepID=A0ABT1HTJ0_STRSD|nr:Protein of unknown function (DUF1360) [Streptoalloteichus tenebrarius]